VSHQRSTLARDGAGAVFSGAASQGDSVTRIQKKPVQRLLATAMLAGMSMIAATPASAASFNPADTSVQMFRWRWNDIAKECTSWLGPQGYGAVQVSPPHASASLGTWYDVYQPVNYTKLNSLMGTEAEFQSMISVCHAAKVRVYADVVVNHMAGGSGKASDGSTWTSALAFPNFSAPDFHANCTIAGADYSNANRANVTTCRIPGLPDLNTGSTYVQGQIRTYLNKLVAMGVDGMRFDAAKHMAPADIAAFLNGATRTTTAGEPLWITQEVIVDGGVDVASYFPTGTVNEFHYVYAMKEMFQNLNGASISKLETIMGTPARWGGSWGFIPSQNATVFVNNWDTERNDGSPSSLVASNFTGVTNDTAGTKRYNLANMLMLAWPYGSAQVHSGFRFTDRNQGPPAASPFDANGNALVNQQWDFIHRWPEISNMVGFRAATTGEGVANFVAGTANQIAFSRGAKGFIAINNDAAAWNSQSFATGLPAGTYCNVAHGVLNAARTGCTSDSVVVPANGVVTLSMGSVTGAVVPAVALHINQKVVAATCTTVPVKLRVANANTAMGQSLYVAGNRAELGNWAATSAGQLTIEGTGANAAWSRTVNLPPATAIQYKFVKSGAGTAWESNQATPSSNREAVTPACGAATLVLDGGSFRN
jgi:alpha-amylase